MTRLGSDSATHLGTVSSVVLLDALTSVRFARGGNGSLSGVLLYVQPGTLLVAATDDQRLAYRTVAAPRLTAAGVPLTVPTGLIEALGTHMRSEEELELGMRGDGEDGELCVRGTMSGSELVQPLWGSARIIASYSELSGGSASTTAFTSAEPFRRLREGVPGKLITVAVTPKTVILRTEAGMLGAPEPAGVAGTPAQAVVDVGFAQGADFVLANMEGFSQVFCEVSESEGMLRVRGAETRQGQAVYADAAYVERLESRRVPENVSAVAEPEPGEAYVPEPTSDISGSGVSKPELSVVLAKLEAITGQESVKAQVHRLVKQAELATHRANLGLKSNSIALHVVFSGPPGTGKTTVARLLADLFYALDVLPSNKLVEVDRSRLVSSNVGGTEEKTLAAIEEAMGGVLFIDEAYALAGAGGNDFGKQAIETLLKAIEDRRGDFACIAAGYSGEMKVFLDSNPGMKSRFTQFIEFAPYTAEELCEIAATMSDEGDNVLNQEAGALLERRLGEEELRGGFERNDWGNARTVRNLIESAVAHRDERVSEAGRFDRESLSTIDAEDIAAACDGMGIGRKGGSVESVASLLAELDAKVGQPELKQQVRALRSTVEAMQQRAAHGMEPRALDLPHLLFTGPPGTGKTSIARLLARLYKALGLLPSGHLVEVDQASLVSSNVGGTAELTTQRINDAIGGVLFIDEAYTLAQSNQFGTEAINTLLKRMSDDAGRFVVIAAGYTEPMQQFLDANAGLSRRFATTIRFAPYSADELAEIGAQMVSVGGGQMSVEADRLLRERLSQAEQNGVFERQDWGNAGSVQNLISHAARLRDLRVTSDEAGTPTREDLITFAVSDLEQACDALFGGSAAKRESVEEVLAELNDQIGQPHLKQQVAHLMAGVRAQQAREGAGLAASGSLIEHLVFTGPPGTGKTTIARQLARLYAALGVLPSGHVVEVDRSGLVAGYLGQTGIKTDEQISKAFGGVLFIDEAYTLVGDDFGREAIDTLLARMENDRGKFMVIVAGYPEQMDGFLRANPGLPSRFTQKISFAPYSAEELTRIAVSMAAGMHDTIADEAVAELRSRLDVAELDGTFVGREWGNARAVRNLINKAIQARNSRLFADPSAAPQTHEVALITLPDMVVACDAEGLRTARGLVASNESEPDIETLSIRRNQTSPSPALTRASRWREHASPEELAQVRGDIKTLIGEAARQLAPGAEPGTAVPVGSELAALGFTELYWQGGTSMGMQLRFTAGSRDRMHYVAGGSNGLLPDSAGFRGDQVPRDRERSTVDDYPLHTLEEWQGSDLDLADAILASIRADLNANPE